MAAAMLSHQSTTGFYKAPVCKGLMGSMFLTCTAIHVPMMAHLRQYLSCQVPGVLNWNQVWRLLFNRLTFLHSKDVFCSLLVIYYFRIFERRMGSRKFASHLLGSCTIATVLEILTILTLAHFNIDYHNGGFLPPGLYGCIFPFYVNYFLDIPRVGVTHFLGIPVTGKTITYLLGLQIAATSPASAIASLCGIVGGLIYRWNIFRVQKWLVVPKSLASITHKAFGWALYSKEPKETSMGATLELQRAEAAELWEQQFLTNRAQEMREARGQGYSQTLIGPSRPPSDTNVQLLVEMGFERSRALAALRSTNDDLNAATSILLRQ